MSTNITWEEPPGDHRGRPTKMPVIVEQLKTRPGQWARIEVGYKTAAGYTKRHPGIEITARNLNKPDEAVYARYIGEDANDA